MVRSGGSDRIMNLKHGRANIIFEFLMMVVINVLILLLDERLFGMVTSRLLLD